MADLQCYYCHRNIVLMPGTGRTFMVETDPDPSAPAEVQRRDRFHCEVSPSFMHYPEAYKIVEAGPRIM